MDKKQSDKTIEQVQTDQAEETELHEVDEQELEKILEKHKVWLLEFGFIFNRRNLVHR